MTKSVVNAVVATLTIAFLTLFMLLEGPNWVERLYSLLPETSQPRWRRVGREIYRTVGGYVTGNLAISFIAGVTSTIVLLVLGVPYAVALGLLVAILDLIPLAGATIAAIIVSTVGFLDSLTAGIVLIVFLLYQQFENHVLQPLVYGRTVQLSPLIVLIAVLMGAKLAGVIGRWARSRSPARFRWSSSTARAPPTEAARAEHADRHHGPAAVALVPRRGSGGVDLFPPVDASAELWVAAGDQHVVLRDRCPVEAEERRRLHILQSPPASHIRLREPPEHLDATVELGARQLPAAPAMYTACALPTGTVESKIAIATSGRAETFRECRASGDETQWKVL